MRVLRRAGEAVWHYRLTTITSILVIAVVVLFALSERATSEAKEAAALVERETNARLSAVESLQAALEAEARQRTTESCRATAASRDGTINLWNDVIDFLTPSDPAQAARSVPALDGLRAIVAKAYPPVTCPQDQGPIVIPTPATSTP